MFRFLSLQQFYGSLKKFLFLCRLFVLAMCLRSPCPHHIMEQNCQNSLSSTPFIPSLFPLLSLGLPCVTTTSKPWKFVYLFKNCKILEPKNLSNKCDLLLIIVINCKILLIIYINYCQLFRNTFWEGYTIYIYNFHLLVNFTKNYK